MRIRYAGILGTLFLLCGACSEGSLGNTRVGLVHWADVREETAVQLLAQTSPQCRGCVRFDLEVVIGDTTGPGYVVHSDHVVRDSSHRYWLGQYRDMVKVFDSAGRYVTTVGQRGSGPGEYDTPLPLYTDSIGRVHILDAGLPRRTVVFPDFRVQATSPLPMSPWSLVPLGTEETFVVNVPVQTTASLGHPLHIVRGATVVRSFGALRSAVIDPFDVRRAITVDHSGRIYSARTDEFLVEVWTDAGHRIVGLRGDHLRGNDPPAETETLYTPASALLGIRVDQSEQLWLLILHPRDDWRESMDEVALRNGQKAFRPKNGDFSKIYSSRIVVVALAEATIVADERRPEYFAAFLGDRMLVEARYTETGVPQIALWNIALQPTTERK